MSRYRRITVPGAAVLERRVQPVAEGDAAAGAFEVTTHCGPSGIGVDALRTPR